MNGSIFRATPSQVGVLSQRERGIFGWETGTIKPRDRVENNSVHAILEEIMPNR